MEQKRGGPFTGTDFANYLVCLELGSLIATELTQRSNEIKESERLDP
jgi:hypothetical protein